MPMSRVLKENGKIARKTVWDRGRNTYIAHEKKGISVRGQNRARIKVISRVLQSVQ